jgi:ABC-type nitrate/sulfonate/bicarbonate transport system substrate-binding protein
MKPSFIAFALFLLLPCTVFSQPEEGTKLRVSYSVINAASLVTRVAKDGGIFRKHGLDVDLIYIGSATKTVSATISG